jgi:hypothetical protein
MTTTRTRIYNLHGVTIRSSANLRGVLAHYRAKPADMTVKVTLADEAWLTHSAPREALPNDATPAMYACRCAYAVTFYWPDGDNAVTHWADWRVLLTWLAARRSWSISRVTFDAPLYDAVASDPRLAAFRRDCAPLTRHAYARA